jgi:hypothetical protein
MPGGNIVLDSYQEYLHMTTVIQLHCGAVATSWMSFKGSTSGETWANNQPKDDKKFSLKNFEPIEIQKVLIDGIS